MAQFNTTSIRFTARSSVKIRDSYFTFEACIEKQCPPEEAGSVTEEELAQIKKQLWDECNSEIDNQVEETYELIKNANK